jgi:hypothetical protein
MGCIGYAARKDFEPGTDLVRIFINCENEPPPDAQPLLEPADLRPPEDVRFLHAVDVVFLRRSDEPVLRGLDSLSAVRRFNRFLGALAERAREQGEDPNSVFASADNLLATLGRIKNSRQFTP